ncbi:MAG: cytochrome c3 family protein [Desulfobulbaceae bacterium]|nr:cytochrome c3 family protein [Desulfobulbaceae bacterium]
MSKNKSCLYSSFVLAAAVILACLTAAGAAGAYTIHTPPASDDRLFIQSRRPFFNMVIEAAPDELERLRVEEVLNRDVDTRELSSLGQWVYNGNFHIHYILPLKNGNNSFIVNPGGKEVNIYYRQVRSLLNVDVADPKAYLFHREEVMPAVCTHCHSEKLPDDAGLDVTRLEKNADYSPVCFSCHRRLIRQSKWLHSPSANVFCWSCHQQEEEGSRVPMLSGRVDDNCFTCHVNKHKFMNDFVHGPVGTGDCTVCHDPHGGQYEFQLWADSKADLCVGCHLDKKNVMKKTIGFYPHGIIQGGGCIVCHNTHADGYRFQLYDTINNLCVSCHTGLQDVEKGHPVGNHPLKGKPDPLRAGRELACSSCHNPHGSYYRYLLIGDLLGGHVCSKCHR